MSDDTAASSRGRVVRKAIAPIALGLAALTIGAAAGVWYNAPATTEAADTFASRVDAVGDVMGPMSIAPKTRAATVTHPYIALFFDPSSSSPGASPVAFSQDAPAPEFPLKGPSQSRMASARSGNVKLASLTTNDMVGQDAETSQDRILPLPETPQVALGVPMPRARPAIPAASTGPSREEIAEQARATKLAAMTPDKRTLLEKIFGMPQHTGPALAYAAPDGGVLDNGQSVTPGRLPLADRQTAVYDISARKVYMPDGTTLEAHSGLGNRLDDPRFVHERMRGATPPALYELKLRESLFHGVQALRLNPVNSSVYGRSGLLAHTYMLGPNGDSNGCVSFRNYEAFLRAYNNGDVKRLLVVAKVS